MQGLGKEHMAWLSAWALCRCPCAPPLGSAAHGAPATQLHQHAPVPHVQGQAGFMLRAPKGLFQHLHFPHVHIEDKEIKKKNEKER